MSCFLFYIELKTVKQLNIQEATDSELLPFWILNFYPELPVLKHHSHNHQSKGCLLSFTQLRYYISIHQVLCQGKSKPPRGSSELIEPLPHRSIHRRYLLWKVQKMGLLREFYTLTWKEGCLYISGVRLSGWKVLAAGQREKTKMTRVLCTYR